MKTYITESKLIEVFEFQYNDVFSLILTKNKFDFLNILKKQVQIHLQILNKNATHQSMLKTQDIFSKKYLTDKKKVIKSYEQIQSKHENELEYLDKLNCIIHCPCCSQAYHSCGYRLVLANDFVFCLSCMKVYNEKQVNLFCDVCNLEYISQLREIKDYTYSSFYPVSINKYHCKLDYEEKIKCPNCKRDLYVNISNPINNSNKSGIKEVECLKCNSIFITNKFTYKCKICNIFFKSNPKIFNEFNFLKNDILTIAHTIINGKFAFPERVKYRECYCNLNMAKKYKHTDGGTLYEGIKSNKKIIVCDNCFQIFDPQFFEWNCFFCQKKINYCKKQQDENDKNSSQKNNMCRFVKKRENSRDYSKISNKSDFIIKPHSILHKNPTEARINFSKSILNNTDTNLYQATNNNFSKMKKKDYFGNNLTKEIFNTSCNRSNCRYQSMNTQNNNMNYSEKLLKSEPHNNPNPNQNINIKIQTFYNNYMPLIHIVKKDKKRNIFMDSRGFQKDNIVDYDNSNNELQRNYSLMYINSLNSRNIILPKTNKSLSRSITEESIRNNINLTEKERSSYWGQENTNKIFNNTLNNIRSNSENKNKKDNNVISRSSLKRNNNNIILCTLNKKHIKKSPEKKKVKLNDVEIIKEEIEDDKCRHFKIPINDNDFLYEKFNLNKLNLNRETKEQKENKIEITNKKIVLSKQNPSKKFVKIYITKSKTDSKNLSNNNKLKKQDTGHRFTEKNSFKNKNINKEKNLHSNNIINHSKSTDKRKLNNSGDKAITSISSKNKFKKEFNSEDYNILRIIGEGTFGKIFLVENSKTKEQYALKKITATERRELEISKEEFELLMKITQENENLNLVKIYGIQIKQLDKFNLVLYVLMEAAISDWEKEIKNRRKNKNFYSEIEITQILKSLVKTFAFLQRRGICHRDVKPQNILYFKKGKYKITDFGEAKAILKKGYFFCQDTSMQTVRGTELYMSPILFKALHKTPSLDLQYNAFKSDVFSLGLCILLACKLDYEVLYEIREIVNMKMLENIIRKHLKKSFSEKFIGILNIMLQIEEKNRPDFIELEEILKHKC